MAGEEQEIAARCMELLGGIDPETPAIDQELAGERLVAYVRALGVETVPKVRWLPDLRALRKDRVRPGRSRHWQSFSKRQGLLLWRQWERVPEPAPRLAALARLDRSVLAGGSGVSEHMRAVYLPVPEVVHVAANWARNFPVVSRRVPALVPLAEAAAAGLFAFAVHEQGTFVCVPRPLMRLDDEGRPHDWDGRPALEWRKGGGLWFWRGVEMTEAAGRRPDQVTPRRIASWVNVERRRVAIERIGLEAFIRGIGAEIVQEDDYGRLWRSSTEAGGERWVAVEVVNATAEPDGSYRHYFLRVPPSTRSARAAVAWTFDVSVSDYVPAVET